MRTRTGAPQSTANQRPQWRASSPGDPVLRDMTDMLSRQDPTSAAEALKALRSGYPDIPLALRIAALRARSAK